MSVRVILYDIVPGSGRFQMSDLVGLLVIAVLFTLTVTTTVIVTLP